MAKSKQKKQLQPPQRQDERPGRQHKMKPQPDSGGRGYRGSGKLADRVALITGTDSGI